MSDVIAPHNAPTPILALNKPLVDGDIDIWGDLTNANWDILDKALLTTGGTLTGPLTIDSGTDPTLYITSPTGSWPGVTMSGPAGYIQSIVNGQPRWEIDLGDGSAETGGNAGSNFGIARYNDAGSQIGDYAFLISRATGIVTAEIALSVGAGSNNVFSVTPGAAAANPIVLGHSGSGGFEINGNVGIGVAPPAGQAVPTGTGGWSFSWGMTTQNWASNLYYGADSNWHYLVAGNGLLAQEVSTGWIWLDAPSGAVGAVATLTQRMYLDLNGNLSVGGSLSAVNVTATNLFANTAVYVARNTASNFVLYGDSSYLYQQYESSWFWQWNRASGTLAWIFGSTVLLSIDGSGNLATHGAVSAPALTASGAVTGGYMMSTSGTYYVAGNTAYYFGRNSSNGAWQIVQNNAAIFNLDTSGTLTAYNNVIAVGNLYGQNGGCMLGAGGNGRIMQFSQSWYLDWNATNGTLTYIGGGALWWADGSGNMVFTGSCWANAFNLNSDRRIKRNIQPWARGLAEVIQLQPVSFEYNGEGGLLDDGTTHYGFVAQDAQVCLPEAVHVMPPPSASVERTVTNQLAFNNGTLIAATVNAIKELAARVVALESAGVA
jgi:hypothetical protein